MARGGYRPGGGRPPGSKKGEKKAEKKQKVVEKQPILPESEAKQAAIENLDPLSYMLKVMNDPSEEESRRDRMAVSAAPFCHARKGEGTGKRQEKDDKAKSASSGKFAPSMPPMLKAVK